LLKKLISIIRFKHNYAIFIANKVIIVLNYIANLFYYIRSTILYRVIELQLNKLLFRLLSNSVFLLHLKELRDVLEILNSILLIELLLFFYKKVNICL